MFQIGSTAGTRAGSGLGLAIVRAIVTAHDGTLEIASAVGVGTRVTIHLPGSLRERRGPLARGDATTGAAGGSNRSGIRPVGITMVRG
jgi:hypothetical protein